MSSGENARSDREDQTDFAGEILLEALRDNQTIAGRSENGRDYKRVLFGVLVVIVALTLIAKCATDVKSTFFGDSSTRNESIL